jgi:hypothetical protein
MRADARSYAELSSISDAAPATTCGNHRANSPRHPGHLRAWFPQVKRMEPGL